MTRETKIGLLVGLAFIIVIGILLSDHLTSSTEPMPAMLGQAGESARQAIATPGAAQPPINVVSPVNMQPKTPVPTQVELQRPNPVQIVQVGGPSVPANDPEPTAATRQPDSSNLAPGEPVANADVPNVTRTPAGVSPTLLGVATQAGEPLVDVGNAGNSNRTPTQTTALIPSRTGVREYKAEANDTLGRIAAKIMGANNKANRDALVAANPSLKADPNLIIAGRTYAIPAAGVLQVETSAPVAPVLANIITPPTREREVGEYYYTVKSSDNLWKIATEQCGRGAAVAAIKELNRDLLKGAETVRPGMKLRLPSRPVASAN